VRYCGPFEILDRIALIAYMLALLAYMIVLPTSMHIHNVFHVCLLKKYVLDPNNMIDWIMIQVEHEGDFWVGSVQILDRKFKVLKIRAIF
jgi:hypothetical protein